MRDHQYADDTQLYIAVGSRSTSNSMSLIENCMSAVQEWFLLNELQLNPDKSEVLLLGSAAQRRVYTGESQLQVAGKKLNVVESLRLLGVQIDAGLTMDKQTMAICISCNYHIRALRHIRRHLPSDVANIVACSLVRSRLDYCNALLYGISQSKMTKLAAHPKHRSPHYHGSSEKDSRR